MIIDSITNRHLYQNASKGIKQGLDFIENTNLEEKPAGKYELENGLIAIVAEYKTKAPAECVKETHLKYIDIQYLISGTETIGFAPLADKQPTIAYNAEKDVAFYNTEVSELKLKKGMFCIFYPTDIHMPSAIYKQAEDVKKLVIKVPVV